MLVLLVICAILGGIVYFYYYKPKQFLSFKPDMTEPNYPEVIFVPEDYNFPETFPEDKYELFASVRCI